MTSIAPLRVAGLIEFHVFETDPPMLRTYCISNERATDPRYRQTAFSLSLADA